MVTQAQWVFLAQQTSEQQGERQGESQPWQPLAAIGGQLTEGRYRIIARIGQPNLEATIQIAHTDPSTKRRSKQKTATSNDKGTLLLMPFTTLKPGKWEFAISLNDRPEPPQKLNFLIQPLYGSAAADPNDIPQTDRTPIAADPIAAELEAIFAPPLDPTLQPTKPVVDRATIAQEDAISLEALFGDSGADNDLAAELNPEDLATIGQGMAAIEPEPDPWAAQSDDPSTLPASMTQLEVVSDDDETLLDWEGHKFLGNTPLETEPTTELTPDPVETDEFAMFDDLFSALETADSADAERIDVNLQLLLQDDEPDSPEVMTFTDIDALAIDAANDHPIDLETADLSSPELPILSEPIDLASDPNVWGMRVRSGASAHLGNPAPIVEPPTETSEPIAAPEPRIASPAEVDALLDASDILPAAPTPEPTIQPITGGLPPLTIELDPSFYNFRGGEALMVYGRVISETLPALIDQGEIVVKLIDPQTATQVAEYRQPLQRADFPIAIAAPLAIKADVQAQLLVGEVAIWDDGIEELAQVTFTAMAAVESILATIDPEAVAEEMAALEAASKPPKTGGDGPLPPVDFGFFTLIGDAPENAPEPAPRKKRESMQEVELPGEAESEIEELEPIAGLTELDDDLFNIDDLELENPLAPEPEPIIEPAAGLLSTTGEPLPDDWLELSLETDVTTEGSAELAAIEELAIDDVNLETEPPNDLAAAIAPEPEVIEMPLDNPDPASGEVVVDDLPETLPTPTKASEAGNNPLLVPLEEAIPEPTIEILELGELVTGQPVRIRVKLPNILPKLYVKLWINDRQSRTLLDGPRWMVDFMPNGRNELEATTQLTVPFGSLEIQVAAITVEATTKRESYRTAVNRTVIPPNLEDDEDLSALNFDAF